MEELGKGSVLTNRKKHCKIEGIIFNCSEQKSVGNRFGYKDGKTIGG